MSIFNYMDNSQKGKKVPRKRRKTTENAPMRLSAVQRPAGLRLPVAVIKEMDRGSKQSDE